MSQPQNLVFSVQYQEERYKQDAINALNAIRGVKAKNDDKGGDLSRDVTVTLTDGANPRIPGKILAIFGTVKKKFVVLKVTFQNPTDQKNALMVLNALKGVDKVEFEGNAAEHKQLTLKIVGDANPVIVLTILQKYGTARFQ